MTTHIEGEFDTHEVDAPQARSDDDDHAVPGTNQDDRFVISLSASVHLE
jgi:hypothetical protein